MNGDEPMPKNLKILVLVSLPRTLSTLLMRTLMNYPNSVAYCDQFCKIAVDKQVENDETPLEELLMRFKEKVLEESKGKELLIIKDHGNYIHDYYMDCFGTFLDSLKPKLMYLVRHPKPTYVSFAKAWEEEMKLNRLNSQVIEYEDTVERFSRSWAVYQKYPAKVIVAEDLQADPTNVMKEIYEYIGLDFDDKYLTFKPLNQLGVPENMVAFSNWYQDCFNSTHIRPGVTNIDEIKVENENTAKKIEEGLLYYNKFVEERKKYTIK